MRTTQQPKPPISPSGMCIKNADNKLPLSIFQEFTHKFNRSSRFVKNKNDFKCFANTKKNTIKFEQPSSGVPVVAVLVRITLTFFLRGLYQVARHSYPRTKYKTP